MPAIIMHTTRSRVEARLRDWVLVGVALLALPAALLPESFDAQTLLEWIASISLERIGGIAALSNALTLMP